MNPTRIDFLPRKPSRWIGWFLLVVGMLVLAEMNLSYTKAQEAWRVIAKAPTGTAGRARAQGVAATGAVADAPDEAAHARRVVARLAYPWMPLIKAIERTAGETVALLAIQPDSAAGTLILSGEAKNYLEVLNYRERLLRAPEFRDVVLLNHEVRTDDPHKPVLFTISLRIALES